MTDKAVVEVESDKDMDGTINMVMQMIMMVVVVAFMQSAQQYFRSQRYEGQSSSLTLLATSIPQHVVLANPWVGAYFTNDGPGIVEVRINDENSSPYTLYSGETKTINRIGADNRIYAIFYKCYPEGTATVRVDGVY